ncbi:MAG TPA: hypothetical protein VJS66_00110 [Burkholderiales bacterium]|nr:hypothetical protein [Burkholderiales bacterium]
MLQSLAGQIYASSTAAFSYLSDGVQSGWNRFDSAVSQNNLFGYWQPESTGNAALDGLYQTSAAFHNLVANAGNAGMVILNAPAIGWSIISGKSLNAAGQDLMGFSMSAGGPLGPELSLLLSSRYTTRVLANEVALLGRADDVGNKASTLTPGPFAKESIPAHRGRPTAPEQLKVNEM